MKKIFLLVFAIEILFCGMIFAQTKIKESQVFFNSTGHDHSGGVNGNATLTVQMINATGTITASSFIGDGSGLTGIATPTFQSVLNAGNYASATMFLDDNSADWGLKINQAGAGYGELILNSGSNYGILISDSGLSGAIFAQNTSTGKVIDAIQYGADAVAQFANQGTGSGILIYGKTYGIFAETDSSNPIQSAIYANIPLGAKPSTLYEGHHGDTSATGKLFKMTSYDPSVGLSDADTFIMNNSGSISIGDYVVEDTTNMLYASSATATAGIKLMTTSTGAADGPRFTMKHNPWDGSEANNNVMGFISWEGIATETANINVAWDDISVGSRDASMHFNIVNGDALTEMMSISSNGTDTIKISGGLQLDTGTRPTCDSSVRGMFWYEAGGAGVADTVAVCAKDIVDAYAWRVIY